MISFSSGRSRRGTAGTLAGLVTLAAVSLPAEPSVAGPEEPPLVTPPAGTLSIEQALARATQTNTPVPVEAATTATDEITANPDGTLTLSRSALPTRKRVDGSWRELDATLETGPDGTVSPTTATNRLTLSGGGAGPMATMTSAGMSIAFTLPMSLPTPTLSGASATYAGVLPDVDLVVTADVHGGMSHVFVVHTADAAANPAVRRLALATQTTGVTMAADPTGNISGTDRTGRIVVTAPAPLMWDSTTPATQRAAGSTSDDSTVGGPGAGAKVAPIAVQVTATEIELTPDTGMLNGASTTYPVYIDPTFTWSSVGASNNGWATVAQDYASTNYWNDTPDPQGRMQVGWAGSIRSRTLINLPIATSTLAGATINAATLSITETWSYSCTPSRVNLYAPSATLTPSNATWNHWSGVSLGAVADYKEVAHGYNSGCPAAGVSFDVRAEVSAAVTGNKKTQTFVLVAANETDTNGWKKFLETSPRLTVTYNHTPNKPTGMSTSPATACTAATPTTVGDGQVTLYAPVSDRNGGTLGVTFNLWKTSAPGTIIASSNPNQLTYNSGSTAVLTVPVATLRTAAGGAITQFSWRVRVTDFNEPSDWSTTCNLRFDPTRTGPPTVTQPADGTTTIGQSVTVDVTPPAGSSTPTGYLYQLNGGPPGTVTADSGNATITVTPTRFTNTLTVTSLSAGGNVGDTAAVTFNSAPAATAPDADLTGDGVADLLTVGATNNLPSGLWLGAGKNTGQIVAATTNIGANGNGILGTNNPADFDGAQVITGHFTGTGLQDMLIYYPTGYPATGDNAGGGVILRGNGDGSTVQSQLTGNRIAMWAGALSDLYGLNPRQLANAGGSSGLGGAYPDLIGIGGDGSVGYYLTYYANQGGTLNYQFPAMLPTPTPDGGYDWNTWTIATAQTTTGTGMFLWQPSTGALHLWTDLAFDVNYQTFSYTAHTIRTSGWNTGAGLTLHAADLDGNGTPDVWTVGANGQTIAHLTSDLNGSTGNITAQTAQNLLTATHSWPLNDATDGPVTGNNTATDTVGALTATGTGNAGWNTGDLYDPDITLDGTNSTLTTSGPALATNADFTVSAWVKPTASGGTVLSQDGTNTAGFKLWAHTADNSWRFAMSTTDAASPTWNTASAATGTVRLGVWTHLTATYKHSTGLMELYVNGVNVAYTTHTVTWNATGAFRFGAHRASASGLDGYLNGQLADVQVWNQVIDPAQAATPASYYQPITQIRALDTRNGTGGTTGPVSGGSTVRLKIAGANGIPASNVAAVAVNVTVVSPSGGGHIIVWPDNTPRPVSSAVNYVTDGTIANYLITPVGGNGYINLYNSSASLHLLADITGYFTTDPAATGNTTFTPTPPTRLMDTRDGTGGTTGPVGSGSTTTLQVTGATGIPTGATAAAINLTVVNATAAGFLITHADGTARPAVSGLQFPIDAPAAAMAIIPIGANGKIAIYKHLGGDAHIIADVVGYFAPGTSGQKYHAINATRMIDTRQDGGPIPAQTTKKVSQGNTVIANAPTLILNVTVTQPTTGGHITAYDDSTTRPTTSNVNFTTGQTIAGLTLPTAAQGTIGLYNNQATGHTNQLVVDCLGYFSY